MRDESYTPEEPTLLDRYYLVDGSESNCNVYIHEGGLMDIEHIDKSKSYSFMYEVVEPDGGSLLEIYDSEQEGVTTSIRGDSSGVRKFNGKADSNTKSDV